MAPTFEIHLENWNSALHIDDRNHTSPADWLIDTLYEYGVHPVVYVVKDDSERYFQEIWDAELCGYQIKSHGRHHYYDEKADRSPYFNQEGQPGACGGFYFRVLPLWFIKNEITRTGLFYIHPHDLDETHPRLRNPIMHWKRHVGLKGAKAKLEKLLKEVTFE